MAVGGREHLDTDDLLKSLEGPARKRRRLSPASTEPVLAPKESLEENFVGLEGGEYKNNDSDDSLEEDEPTNSSFESGSGSEREDVVLNVSLKRKPSRTQTLFKEFDSLLPRISVPSRHKISDPSENSKKVKISSNFASMGVSRQLVAALTAMSITVPTEVQAACIPPLLQGRDCVGNAKTGSGKTIAFALPILQRLSVDPYGIFALILTPTRELAFQISDQFSVLGSPLNIRTAVIVGGMDIIAQASELSNRPHVVIATPGRLVDLLQNAHGEWDLSRVKFLVLDEADRLLAPTFAPELTQIFAAAPRERQTCLFTATMTPSIETLIATPPRPGKQIPFIHRMVAATETVDTLEQFYILVPSHVRETYLYHFLCNPPESVVHLRRAPPEPVKHSKKTKPQKTQKKKPSVLDDDDPLQPPPTIIFCARARTAAYLTRVLKSLSFRSTDLHSRLTQRERLNSLSLFRSYVVPILICTDVASRGLDIEDVAIVINWDMPDDPEEYTHRVGRTARRGRGGFALSFVTERDEERVHKIEERIRTKLTEMTLPEEKVLLKLNAVATAKRMANMELHDSDFGKREKIHKMKKLHGHQDSTVDRAAVSI